MTNSKKSQSKPQKEFIRYLRLFNRIWGGLIAAFLIFMILGHIIGPSDSEAFPTLLDLFAMIFFPVGVTIGLIYSFKNEYTGGFITVFCMLVFYLIILIPRLSFRMIPTTLIIVGPGIISLWLSQQKPSTK